MCWSCCWMCWCCCCPGYLEYIYRDVGLFIEIAQTDQKIPVQLPGIWLLFNKNHFTEFYRFFIIFFWKYVILNERFSAQLYVVYNIHCRYKYFYMILFSPSDIESFDTNKIYARKTFTKYISSICAARLNAKIVTETYHRYMCARVWCARVRVTWAHVLLNI